MPIPIGANKLVYVRQVRRLLDVRGTKGYSGLTYSLDRRDHEQIQDCLDELERRLEQEKRDEAYRKGVRTLKEIRGMRDLRDEGKGKGAEAPLTDIHGTL